MTDICHTTRDESNPHVLICRALTDQGLVRSGNEDAYYTYTTDRLSLICVADGMGGHENGEYASAEIIRCVRLWSQQYQHTVLQPQGQLIESFLSCIQDANASILATYNQGTSICGSTVTALLIGDGVAAVINVGDSHAYRKRKFRFEQLTTDDVWQNQPDIIDQKLSEDQIRSNADYGKLTAAVGTERELIPHVRSIQIQTHDIFLLCTDGVYKTCGDRWLGHVVTLPLLTRSPQKITRHLDQILADIKCEVYRKGAPDNLTLIAAQVQ